MVITAAKLQLWSGNQNNFMVGGWLPQHELYPRIIALGRLKTTGEDRVGKGRDLAVPQFSVSPPEKVTEPAWPLYLALQTVSEGLATAVTILFKVCLSQFLLIPAL